MPRARADHRGSGERADPAVRMRRWAAAPGARRQVDECRQPRDPVRRAGPRSRRRHAGRRISPAELAETSLGDFLLVVARRAAVDALVVAQQLRFAHCRVVTDLPAVMRGAGALEAREQARADRRAVVAPCSTSVVNQLLTVPKRIDARLFRSAQQPDARELVALARLVLAS